MVGIRNYQITDFKKLIVDNKTHVIELKERSELDKPSIFSDTMAKTMFQNETRLKYSCKLISYFVNIEYEELLKNLKLSKNELGKTTIMDKGCRCDYVADINGDKINIEVNSNGNVETLIRNFYYGTVIFGEKVLVGKRYNFNTMIQFNLNNFSFEEVNDEYTISTMKDDSGIAITDKFIIVQIYIPNVYKKYYNEGIDSLSEWERYALILAEQDLDKSLKLAKDDEFMNDYIKEAEDVKQDGNFVDLYDKELWEHNAIKEIGIDEGFAKAKKEIIKTMYNKGFSKEDINSMTDISMELIEETLAEIK